MDIEGKNILFYQKTEFSLYNFNIYSAEQLKCEIHKIKKKRNMFF